ncbi:unnamed protein product, partial [Oppiella nova]
QIVFDKILPLNKQLFFTYKGSLTTPPCSESVQFIIYADPIRMSPFQLSQFRRLFKKSNFRRIVSNTRDIQRRHGRVVSVSVPKGNKDSNFDDNEKVFSHFFSSSLTGPPSEVSVLLIIAPKESPSSPSPCCITQS